MSDAKDDRYGPKFIEAITADSVENLKMHLKSRTLMVMAIMDALDISEIALTRESLLEANGSIESYYDFDTDGYIVRRIKKTESEEPTYFDRLVQTYSPIPE